MGIIDAPALLRWVTCNDFEIPPVTEYMVGSKGTMRTYAVPQGALAEAAGAPEVMDAVVEGAM